jgi:hypothetical protein
LVRLATPRPRTTRELDEMIDRVRVSSGSRQAAKRAADPADPRGAARAGTARVCRLITVIPEQDDTPTPGPAGCVDS